MKSESNQSLVPIIVYFTPEFSNPIISEKDFIGGDFNKIIESKMEEIKNLEAKVREFCSSYGINPESIFYLFEVGFTSEFPLENISSLEADQYVKFLEEDIIMQSGPASQRSRPRMQGRSRPRMQGRSRPRMQNGELVSLFEPYDTQFKTSCAVLLSGGPVPNSSSRRIWVLDTGIDGNHPDLNVNSQLSTSFPSTLGSPLVDKNGHGTHCAGIAAAKSTNGNLYGMNGISMGAELVSVKILNECGIGRFSYVFHALEHVLIHKRPGDVVMLCLGAVDPNLSFDTDNPISLRIKWLTELYKVFVVMSAGNDYGDANLNFPGSYSYPTRAITVAALDYTCQYVSGFALYSNFGTCAKWAAPGSDIYSTLPNNDYGYMSGTSMACALTAGIVHAKNDLPSTQEYITYRGQDYKIPHL